MSGMERSKGNWIVDTKGGANEHSFEISVVRQGHHGVSSYGWFDEDKLLISHDGGPCRVPVTQDVWDGLVCLANKVASNLNNKEENINE